MSTTKKYLDSTGLSRLLTKLRGNILQTVSDCSASTDSKDVAGAAAVKALNSNLTDLTSDFAKRKGNQVSVASTSYLENGIFSANNLTGAPTTGWIMYFTFGIDNGTSYKTQIAITLNNTNPNIYFRNHNGSSGWTSWKLVTAT